jgi:Flp pilus assembly CpaF family ATPase
MSQIDSEGVDLTGLSFFNQPTQQTQTQKLSGGAVGRQRSRWSLGQPVQQQTTPKRMPQIADVGEVIAMPIRPSSALSMDGASPVDTSGVDWKAVAKLRGMAAAELLAWADSRPGPPTSEERESKARDIIERVMRTHLADLIAVGEDLDAIGQETLRVAVFDSMFGLGRLQPLIANSDIENIMAYGYDDVMIEYADGRIKRAPQVADSDEEFLDMIQMMASNAGHNSSLSRVSPKLEMTLPDGSRLAATVGTGGVPSLMIRRHRIKEVGLDDLVELGSISPTICAFLRAAVKARMSIVVCGDQAAGKTTFLRALCTEFGYEVISTFEEDYEIFLHKPPLRDKFAMVFPWVVATGGGEFGADGKPVGTFSMEDQMIAAKRYNTKRYVVGEIRGREVMILIKAMEEGAGTLSTTHATDAKACIQKLITCAQESEQAWPSQVVAQKLSDTLNLVVHLCCDTIDDGQGGSQKNRYVDEITAVTPGEATGSGVSLQPVFGRVPGSPAVAYAVPDSLVPRLQSGGWTESQEHEFRAEVRINHQWFQG